ncbi:OmpA family protein [Sulfuricurvum sp.]|uniref:OmpA family protein n=1 Tax=Sulfuricurvum sp. TaxID=2025608 RepID=UPI0026376D9C|nr:OmpA family protein [Sulfuricurvum sp.]MDD2781769.1 OmpA family protein [Sulfuricurvum sp.]
MKNPLFNLHTALALSALLMGSVVNIQAAEQNITYFDGEQNRTMSVAAESFAPKHPDCCLEKKSTPITSSVPVTVVAPAVQSEGDADADSVFDSKDQCPDTPKGYQVDAKGCPKSVTLHLNFAFASNLIPTSAAQDVIDLTNFMKNNPASNISIVGHTDIIGNDERNQPRSEARARALADRLITKGIDANRIKTSGKGSKEPIATNNTDAGRAQNRRIEIEIR